MSQHTPEPWESHKTSVYFPNLMGGFDISGCPSPEANARRIVACVNACAGISTELLEQHGITDVLAPSESSKDLAEASALLIQSNARQLRLTAQRDELLAALKLSCQYMDKVPQAILSAIAKCEVQ